MATQNSINERSNALVSDTGLTATTGNITATLGNVVLSSGALTLGISNGTDGQFIFGANAANPAWGSMTTAAGSGITLTPAANALTIATTAPFIWQQVGVNGALVVNQGSINTKVLLLTMSLPAASAVGDIIKLQGLGAGGWIITQGAGQQIIVGNTATTITTGTLASTNANDAVCLICTTANLTWSTFGVIGNLTVV